MAVCSAPHCNKEVYVKGYCRKHYIQIRKYGELKPDKEIYTECVVEGCSEKPFSRGLCHRHYVYMYRHNGEGLKFKDKYSSLRIISNKSKLICSVEGCGEATYARGYCARHYNQMLKYGKVIHIDKTSGPAGKPIDVDAVKILIHNYNFSLTDVGNIVGLTKQQVKKRIDYNKSNSSWISKELTDEEEKIIINMMNKSLDKYRDDNIYVHIAGNNKDICIIIKNGDNVKVLFDIPSEIKQLLIEHKYYLKDNLTKLAYMNMAVIQKGKKKYGVVPKEILHKLHIRCRNNGQLIKEYAELLGIDAFVSKETADKRIKSNEKIIERLRESLEEYRLDKESNLVYIPVGTKLYADLRARAYNCNTTIDDLVAQLGYKRVKHREIKFMRVNNL